LVFQLQYPWNGIIHWWLIQQQIRMGSFGIDIQFHQWHHQNGVIHSQQIPPAVPISQHTLSLVANKKSLQQSHNTSIPSSQIFFKLSQICVKDKAISFLKYLTHNREFFTQNKIFQKKSYHNRKAKRILPNMLSTFSRSKLHNHHQRNSQSKWLFQ
jgi:hypothetical protein